MAALVIDYDSLTKVANSASSLEFSDQLCCLHICGKILCESVGSTANTEEYTEHFLYLERENEREIISAFQQATGVSVRYMDR